MEVIQIVNDKQNNIISSSFSDLRLYKRSAVQNIDTKMKVNDKNANFRQRNYIPILNTNTHFRYKKHSMNILNILHCNQLIKIFHQNIRSLRS